VGLNANGQNMRMAGAHHFSAAGPEAGSARTAMAVSAARAQPPRGANPHHPRVHNQGCVGYGGDCSALMVREATRAPIPYPFLFCDMTYHTETRVVGCGEPRKTRPPGAH
jgi:hypothetical protein